MKNEKYKNKNSIMVVASLIMLMGLTSCGDSASSGLVRDLENNCYLIELSGDEYIIKFANDVDSNGSYEERSSSFWSITYPSNNYYNEDNYFHSSDESLEVYLSSSLGRVSGQVRIPLSIIESHEYDYYDYYEYYGQYGQYGYNNNNNNRNRKRNNDDRICVTSIKFKGVTAVNEKLTGGAVTVGIIIDRRTGLINFYHVPL